MPIITDYFAGHLEWVTNILPREQRKRAAMQDVVPINHVPTPPPERARCVRERLIPGWLPSFLISSTSVFAAALTVYFTIILNRPRLQVSGAFGSEVLIHAFRVSSHLLPMQH